MSISVTRESLRGVVLAVLLCAALPVQAQDRLLEALQEQRQRTRATEILNNTQLPHAGQLAVETVWRSDGRLGRVPQIRLTTIDSWQSFRIHEPEPVEFDTLQFVQDQTWERIPSGEEPGFLLRFGEVLWIGASGHVTTPLDTMATPEIRARLHSLYGVPTRVPVARTRPAMNAGSAFVQFEYWFVVNDQIPVVIMDRDGPFGRGIVIVMDEEYVEFFPMLVENLTRRLLDVTHLMPYVDYYHSLERNAWFRTGYDGETYYFLETDRPRWARRGQERAQWYDFR